MNDQFQQFLLRYPQLGVCSESILAAEALITEVFRNDGTFFCCGNGGSAADCDHICGEFLKGFLLKREIPQNVVDLFDCRFGEEGNSLAKKLQGGLKAVSLLSHPALNSAFANDVDPNLNYAQQLYALGRKGDMLFAISTGGNALNVKYALMAAQVKGLKTVLLTGNKYGVCEKYADISICVPESETYKIQELHLPLYHYLCMAVEEHFFGSGK